MPEPVRDRHDLHAYIPPAAAADTVPRHLRWRDLQDRASAIRLTLYVGVPLFLLLEALVWRAWRSGQIDVVTAGALAFVGVPLVDGLVLWLWLRVLQGVASGLAATIYGSGGQPALVGFSREESLVIRGQVEAAAEGYARRIAEEPANIEARLRLAALQAGPLGRPDDARATYHEARRLAGPSLAYEIAISTALLELFRREGDRAATKAELARHARLLPDTPSGRSALERLRAMTREDAADEYTPDARQPGEAPSAGGDAP